MSGRDGVKANLQENDVCVDQASDEEGEKGSGKFWFTLIIWKMPTKRNWKEENEWKKISYINYLYYQQPHPNIHLTPPHPPTLTPKRNLKKRRNKIIVI